MKETKKTDPPYLLQALKILALQIKTCRTPRHIKLPYPILQKNLLLYCVVSLKSYFSYKNTNSNVKLNRGSYTSAHVLLNLLDELGLKIRCEALPSILSVFPNEFNKFNNTGARMQHSISRMTLKSHRRLLHLLRFRY